MRAKRSNPSGNEGSVDCFVACAPRNDASNVSETQYAFSFFVISANGVLSRMKRSNSTDQFSM